MKTEPINKDNMIIDKATMVWGPALQKRIPDMKRRLIEDGKEKHAYQLKVIDLIEKTFLFEGYQEHFNKQIPRDSRFPIVLSHNDAQENNLMMINGENEKIVMIDYEYGGWNPFAFDIANYISELSLDNAHPQGNGCKVYPSNFPSK